MSSGRAGAFYIWPQSRCLQIKKEKGEVLSQRDGYWQVLARLMQLISLSFTL